MRATLWCASPDTTACTGPSLHVDNPGGHPFFVDGVEAKAGTRSFRYYGTTRVDAPDITPAIELSLREMLGCLATAPARKEAVATSTPGSFGGNMDYAGLNAGVKVTLPVNEPGALLFLGDGHARQGEGEVVGTGVETSMDLEFTVDLIKKKAVGWPRLENETYIMVLGSERPLLQAFQHATTEMHRWLVTDFKYSERGASLLMGQAVEYEIANVVDPHFTVVAKLRKSLLQR